MEFFSEWNIWTATHICLKEYKMGKLFNFIWNAWSGIIHNYMPDAIGKVEEGNIIYNII